MNVKTYLENQNKTMGENSFMKKLLKKRLNQKGLTLIELLAVIVILAIVAAIAIPAIGNIINNSRDKSVLADASSILSAAKLAATENICATSGTTVTCDKADIEQHLDGVTLASGDQAVKSGNTWTVTYSKLANIKNTSKFTVAESSTGAADGYTPPATAIKETALNKALNQ